MPILLPPKIMSISSGGERNATAYEPVIEVIHDNSTIFGQIIELSANK
jgi:hypothetical protein